MRAIFKGLLIGLASLGSIQADAWAQQISTGKVTTAAPTYTTGTAGALSLDTSGNLRVTTTGGGGTSAVNLTQVAGTPVGNTVPGTLDVTCISGCVGGSGVSQGTATTAAPTYTTGTNNPLSLDTAGNLRVLGIVTGNVASGATDSGNPVKIGGVFNTTMPTLTNAQRGDAQLDARGNLRVLANFVSGAGSDGAGNAVQGFAGQSTSTAGAVTPGAYPYVFNGTTWDRMRGTTGGTWVIPSPAPATLPFHLIAAASNNSTLISAGAHALFSATMGNTSANIAFLKIYDKATAPTCGTDVPIATYIIPGATAGGAGSNIDIALGTGVTLGLGICVVAGIADTDNTSVAASAYAINLTYK